MSCVFVVEPHLDLNVNVCEEYKKKIRTIIIIKKTFFKKIYFIGI